jgi:hypothetical protein
MTLLATWLRLVLQDLDPRFGIPFMPTPLTKLIAEYAREEEQMTLLRVTSSNRRTTSGNELDVTCHEGIAHVKHVLTDLEYQGLELIQPEYSDDEDEDNTQAKTWWATDEADQLTIAPLATLGDALWNKALICADMHNTECLEHRGRWSNILVRIHPETGRLCIGLCVAGNRPMAVGGGLVEP